MVGWVGVRRESSAACFLVEKEEKRNWKYLRMEEIYACIQNHRASKGGGRFTIMTKMPKVGIQSGSTSWQRNRGWLDDWMRCKHTPTRGFTEQAVPKC